MPITLDVLKSRKQDYFVAKWEGEQLVMEPHCFCGAELNDDFFCKDCNRSCDCTFVACTDAQSMSMLEKLIHGEPTFKNFDASLLE